jgi:hypothetical protein
MHKTDIRTNGQSRFFKIGRIVYASFGQFTYLESYRTPYPPLDSYTYMTATDVSTQNKRYLRVRLFGDGEIEARDSNDAIVTSYHIFGSV